LKKNIKQNVFVERRRTAGKTKRVKHGGNYFCNDERVDVAFNNKINPFISNYGITSENIRRQILSGLRSLIKSSGDRPITANDVNKVLNTSGILFASSVDGLVVVLNDFKKYQYTPCTNNLSSNDSSPPNQPSPRSSSSPSSPRLPISFNSNSSTNVNKQVVYDVKQQMEKNKQKEKCKSGPFWRKTTGDDITQCLRKNPGGFIFTDDEIKETIAEYEATEE